MKISSTNRRICVPDFLSELYCTCTYYGGLLFKNSANLNNVVLLWFPIRFSYYVMWSYQVFLLYFPSRFSQQALCVYFSQLEPNPLVPLVWKAREKQWQSYWDEPKLVRGSCLTISKLLLLTNYLEMKIWSDKYKLSVYKNTNANDPRQLSHIPKKICSDK